MSSFDCCSSNVRHGCSKAQACLNKILHIISSIQPPSLSESSKGFDIDLNKCLLGPFWEFGESESLDLSACSFVGKQINQSNDEKTTEGSSSDITNLPEATEVVDQEGRKTKEEEDEDDGVETGPFLGKEQNGSSRSSGDCLALLIAAAELISRTEFECPSPDKEGTETQHLNNEKKTWTNTESSTTVVSKKVRDSWGLDLEDTSPVVRSKRGRSQALPYRYRDSVLLLEPCKRRPPKRASTVVSTKRQSR